MKIKITEAKLQTTIQELADMRDSDLRKGMWARVSIYAPPFCRNEELTSAPWSMYPAFLLHGQSAWTKDGRN